MLCWGNVDAGAALIDRHPDTRFIIVNYEQGVEPFRQTDRLSASERARLMGPADPT
jgi:hypothetical protein